MQKLIEKVLYNFISITQHKLKHQYSNPVCVYNITDHSRFTSHHRIWQASEKKQNMYSVYVCCFC